ncbi:MAG: GlmU family protein [Saprospiraceae bacterium]
MPQIILFDNEVRNHLLPFTYTRPVCELRLGLLRIREKWERWMNLPISYITQDYLAERFSLEYDSENYFVNGSVLPSPQLIKLLSQMETGEAFLKGEELIAAKMTGDQFEQLIHDDEIEDLKGIDLEDTQYLKVNRLWDLPNLNAQAILDDFELLTKGRSSQPISETNRVIGAENIFLEEGVSMELATLNAQNGPIYIGKNATVMEGAILRGPTAIGEGALVKMGAKIYEGTTIGPGAKAGGEIKNVIMLGNCNKSHDGYLGNSVIGEWCNIGAGTSASNLKNDYSEIRIWDYDTEKFIKTGEQFCGLFMGDYSKCAINSMFNTGTVIGICCNLFGVGFPRAFIPSFSYGGHHGFQTYRTNKAFDSIDRTLARREKSLSVSERLALLRVFEDTSKYRRWDKED